MTAVPAARLRGVVAMLGAGELTPTAKRLLLRLCDEYDPPRPTVPGHTYLPARNGSGMCGVFDCVLAEWHHEHVSGPRTAPISPDCAQRKCTACSGDAWDLTGDRPAHCDCRCHDATHSEDAA